MNYTENNEIDEENTDEIDNENQSKDTDKNSDLNKSDDVKERKLKIIPLITSLLKEEKTINTLNQSEFDELVNLPLWEDFVFNSLYIKNSKKQKLEDGFLYDVFLSNQLQNNLIKIIQDLFKKIENKDETDYIFNDNICIKSHNLKSTKDKVYNIILSNNISYIRREINEVVKNARVGTEKYDESIEYAVVGFSQALNKFDTSGDYKIRFFSKNYILSEIKKTFNFEAKIKYPIKLIRLEKILKGIKEDFLEYSNFSYYNLLNEIVFNIDKIDKNIVFRVGLSYNYILSTENKKSDDIDENSDNEIEENEDDILESMKNLPNIMTLIKNPLNEEKFRKRFKELETSLNGISLGVDSLDRPLGDEGDSNTLGDSINDDKYDFIGLNIKIHLIDNEMILDREIKRNFKLESNLDLSLQERIIAGGFIEGYFSIKEFRDLLLKYGESIGHGDRYVKRFHFYLSIFNFKNKMELRKSNWTLIDDEPLDALNFEQVGDIFGFSKQNAMKIYDKIKEKFDNYYTNSVGEDEQKYFVYERTETKDLGHTKTFDWIMRIDESRLGNFHLHGIKQELIDFLKEDEKKFKKK